MNRICAGFLPRIPILSVIIIRFRGWSNERSTDPQLVKILCRGNSISGGKFNSTWVLSSSRHVHFCRGNQAILMMMMMSVPNKPYIVHGLPDWPNDGRSRSQPLHLTQQMWPGASESVLEHNNIFRPNEWRRRGRMLLANTFINISEFQQSMEFFTWIGLLSLVKLQRKVLWL